MVCKVAGDTGAACNTDKLAGGAFGGNTTACATAGAGEASLAAGANIGKASDAEGAAVTGGGLESSSC